MCLVNLYDAQICGTGKDACFQTCTPFLMMQTGNDVCMLANIMLVLDRSLFLLSFMQYYP